MTTKTTRTTCPTCRLPLLWETLGGIRLYRCIDGRDVYLARCPTHGQIVVPR